MTISTERKKDLVALLVCWGVMLLVFARPLSASQNEVIFGYDVQWLFQPTMNFAFDAFRNGHYPLWNPTLFLGFPQYAEPQLSTFYPPMRLLAWMPVSQAIAWLYFLHFGLTASGMYLLARQQGAGQPGGLLAAFSWTLGGFYIAHLYAGHLPHLMTLAYLPWLLLAADIAFRSRRWSKAVLAALPLGLAMLAGYAPFFVLLVLAVTLQMLWYMAQTWRSSGSWKQAVVVVRQWIILGLAAGLISAVQLLPTAQMALLSTRAASADYEFASQLSLPLWSLPTLLIPNLYGSPVGAIYYWKAELYEYWEYALYLGILPLILLLIALVTDVKKAAFWWLLGGAGLILALGPTGILHRLAYLLIPGFGLFRVPARFSALFGLSVSIIAGITLDNLPFSRRQWTRTAALVMVSITAVLFAAALYGTLTNDTFLTETYSERGFLWLAFLISGSISLLLLRVILPVSLWTVFLVAFILLDLAAWGFRFIKIETDVAQEWQTASELLPRDRTTYRVDSEELQENQASLFGFHHVTGYDEFRIDMNKRLDELRMANEPAEAMLGVRYRVQHEDQGAPDGDVWRSAGSANGVKIFERSDALPRAFLVYDVIGVPDLATALAVLSDSRHDWKTTAVVEVAPDTSCDIAKPQSSAAVNILSYEADEVRMTVSSETTGWLVLSDQYYPGWQAAIDGRPAPIQITNAALRGICVPAGTHDITFSFRPALYPAGSALSLSGLLLVVVSAFLEIRKHYAG
ncbi:MAG: YfhO family protein [Candidatus Promineifilaceae bacterium]